MKIGKIELDAPLALAPMAGISDLPYRVLCRRAGCGLTVSEMVSAKGLLYQNEKTFAMLTIDPAERPTAIQLFGSVPEEMAEAARIVAERGADLIDVNMGCPVPKVVRNGEGSALMKDPALAGRILAAMVRAVPIPVTVKFRAGWDDDQRNAVEFAKTVEAAGVAAVAVHGRTRAQFYAGQADWDIIAGSRRPSPCPSGETGISLPGRTACACSPKPAVTASWRPAAPTGTPGSSPSCGRPWRDAPCRKCPWRSGWR